MGEELLILLTTISLLVVLTVSVHALMLSGLRQRLNRKLKGKSYEDHQLREALVISATVLSLALAHLIEIIIWAAGYVLFAATPDPSDAFYVSLTTYTTVGPTGVNIAPVYRSAVGFESLIGPMMVAWSTAFLVEQVTRMRAPPA